MFAEWMRFWCRVACWWVPGMKDPDTDTTKGTRDKARSAREESPDRPEDVTATTADTPDQTKATPSEKTTAASSDDLTAIRGIGPAVARKLNGFGVRTFADLASADPEDLASRLGMRPVTPERVREWIAEARKRA